MQLHLVAADAEHLGGLLGGDELRDHAASVFNFSTSSTRTYEERLMPFWKAALRATRIKSPGNDMPAALAFLFSATGFLAMRKAVSRIVRPCQGMK